MFVMGQTIAREDNMVTRNLHLHVVRRGWSREIHDEVRVLRRGVWQSIDEAQAVNLYPRNIVMASTAVGQSDSNDLEQRTAGTYVTTTARSFSLAANANMQCWPLQGTSTFIQSGWVNAACSRRSI